MKKLLFWPFGLAPQRWCFEPGRYRTSAVIFDDRMIAASGWIE